MELPDNKIAPHKESPEQEFSHSLESSNQWNIPSDLRYLDPTQAVLEHRLAESGWSNDDVFAMGLAFREALTNAIVHGNLGIETEDSAATGTELMRNPEQHTTGATVHVTVEITADKITLTVKDNGKGFDTSSLPDPRDQENITKAHGRGIFIIRSAFNEVVFNDMGNEITMVKHRTA